MMWRSWLLYGSTPDMRTTLFVCAFLTMFFCGCGSILSGAMVTDITNNRLHVPFVLLSAGIIPHEIWLGTPSLLPLNLNDVAPYRLQMPFQTPTIYACTCAGWYYKQDSLKSPLLTPRGYSSAVKRSFHRLAGGGAKSFISKISDAVRPTSLAFVSSLAALRYGVLNVFQNRCFPAFSRCSF